jgi:GNAT superfamily N-acetyltransferase
MNFRTQLRAGDIGEIVRLHGVLYAREYGWDHTFEAYVAESLARFAIHHDPRRERIWIVEADSVIVGSIGIVSTSDDLAQLRWFLLSPSARGHGIGRQLIEQAIEFCRVANYHAVFLWTVAGLDAAAHLYRNAGFQLTEEHASHQWGATVNEQRFELKLT